jgi:hypothetical protein
VAGFGRAHTDDTWNFQTTFVAALFCSQVRHVPLCA